MISKQKFLKREDSVTSRVLISIIRRASLFTRQFKKNCQQNQDNQDNLILEHLEYESR